MTNKTKKIIKIFFVVVLVVLIVFALITNIDLELFSQVVRQIQWKYCLLALPISTLSHWVRAMRWKVYLEPIKPATSNINLFSAVMVGYIINNITPRGGEFVRPIVYARRENISKTSVFATIVVERLIDMIFLLLMFGFVFLLSSDLITKAFPELNTTLLTYMVVGIFVLVVFLFLIISTNIFDKLLENIIKPLIPKYYNRIYSLWNSFKVGLETLKNPRHYLKNFIYSAIIWILYALPLYIMFYAFDFQSVLHLGLVDAGLLVIVSGVGITIAPTPGAIGVYHGLIVAAIIKLYPAITYEEALAYATLTHGVNLILQVMLGIVFMIRENIRKIPSKEELEI